MRIKLLTTALAITWGSLLSAQPYPSKPVTLVVPAAPGGGTDILGRTMAEELGKRLNQVFIIDNKPGASGMIGANAVTRAQPDGYTLLFSYSAPIYYARHMYEKMSYDVEKDLAVISEVAANNLILVVNSELPIINMKDFMSWAEQGKGKLSYGSLGIGSAGHLAAAYLNENYGLDMIHVPYKSEAPFAQELAAGVVPWGMGTLAAMMPHIQSGKVKPIAVLAEQRLPALPEVPTMGEAGYTEPELRSMSWFTLSAPARTPQTILDALEKATLEIVKSDVMQARFQTLGLDPVGGTAADFKKNYEATGPVIEKLVKISGAKAN